MKPFTLLKLLVFTLAALPALGLVWQTYTDALGPEPVETLLHTTGNWGLRLLWLTLAMTPLRRFTGWSGGIRLRRMLGLWAFFYALAHFLIYIGLEQFFDWGEIWRDIVKRPYITLGVAALLMLLPLAVTSTNGMMRRLGRHWKRLHQLVYVIAVCVGFHFLLLVKKDLLEPAIYLLILVVLLLARRQK